MARIKTYSMTEGPLFKSIILYTIPIICTSLLQLLFNAADLIVVGRYCGPLSVAAVGATGSITTLIINLFMGLSVGSGVVVARSMGAQDHKTVHRAVHTSIPAAFISGVVLTIFGIAFSETFLRMMGTPDTVIGLSSVYMKIYFAGMIFSMLFNFAASILRAVGDTKSPLISLTLAGVVNVTLNLFFVIVFDMNVAGVALATIISQAISAVLALYALMHRMDATRLILKEMKIYKAELLSIVKIGLPAGIQGSLFSISNVIIQSSINSFGDVFMSGSAAGGNIEGFVYVCLSAFLQTAVNFIGQNAGANKFNRVKKIYYICAGCVIVVGVTLAIIVCSFSEQLLSIYITDSPEAIYWGSVRMLFIIGPYALCGLMDMTTGSLRGLGESVAPMIISVLGVCGIRIVWIYTIFSIPEYHTPQVLFSSYTISWAVTFIIEAIVFFIKFKQKARAAELCENN